MVNIAYSKVKQPVLVFSKRIRPLWLMADDLTPRLGGAKTSKELGSASRGSAGFPRGGSCRSGSAVGEDGTWFTGNGSLLRKTALEGRPPGRGWPAGRRIAPRGLSATEVSSSAGSEGPPPKGALATARLQRDLRKDSLAMGRVLMRIGRE